MSDAVKVLVVNDDLAILRGIGRLLRKEGYTVYEAATGAQGWELAQAQQPALIILDMVLPDIQGDELCQRLKADAAMAATLIIFFSALHVTSEHRAEGLEMGADGYLTWPMPSREFCSYIKAMVRLQRSETSLRTLNAQLERRIQERTAALAHSNQELEKFVYIASHDLKAPLRAIDQLAAWVAEDAGEQLPPTSQAHLVKLQSRVGRMEKLLDDLLLYSRAGRKKYAPESVDTATLVLEVFTQLAPPTSYTLQLAQPMPTLFTERAPLAMVLQVLIDNGIKHHHEPTTGRMEVGVQTEQQVARFQVTDNGPGIDSAYYDRIFRAFQTLKPRDVVEGSGMGLAIAKRIVESRGGSIEVESIGNQGTTFRFTWPNPPLPK